MTTPTITDDQYLRYSDSLEQIEPDEYETFQKIGDLMAHGADTVHKKEGQPVRISHAKSHGAVVGKLTVNSTLPAYLRQGIFAEPGKSYDVLIRLAHTPGEFVDDRKVSTPRGFSIKVLGVSGAKLPGHSGDTQDFVLDTGKAFIVPGAKSFLQAFKPNAELAPHLNDTVKGAVSTVSRVTNKALSIFGTESGQLDFFGHPFLHPLAECYYSQVPSRFGEYVAEFRVEPVTAGLKELAGKEFEPQDANGLRTDVVDFFKTHDADYVFSVQLATDTEHFPIEDATAKWPEDVSPYQAVAHITIPAQDAYEAARVNYVEALSFSPAHARASMRPLGSLNRARLYAYTALAAKRRNELGVVQQEPESLAGFPA